MPLEAVCDILFQSMLSKISFSTCPSIEVQREIGKIFSDIDRKIALNREINRNLPLAA